MKLTEIFIKKKGFIKAVQGDDNLLLELRKAKLFLITVYKFNFKNKKFYQNCLSKEHSFL